MRPTAYLWHRLPGRARLKIPDRRGDAGWFARARAVLGAAPGVSAVHANPLTASLLVIHGADTRLEDLAALAAAEGLFSLAEEAPYPISAAERAGARLAGVDRGLRRVSAGDLDLRSVLFFTLLTGGIVQALRGQIAIPAASLFWYAAELLIHPDRIPEQGDEGDAGSAGRSR
jgi:hypothetical protein